MAPSLAASQVACVLALCGAELDHWPCQLNKRIPCAGATADAFTLFERLESQLEAHPGVLDSMQAWTGINTRLQQCS